MRLEKDIENELLTWLYLKGIFAWKNQSVGIFDSRKKIFRKSNNKFHINGVSDILCIYRGHFVAIEVKSEKGRMTPDQITFCEKVKLSGGFSFVARSVDDLVENFKLIDLQTAQSRSTDLQSA
jgi:penicillin-binding protein-related factor A (putative recombinase)